MVVVSGLPRSGTSMVMQMLHAGGLPCATDGERAADEDNPKGYFEVERVKRLAEETDKNWVRAHRGEALKVISFLLRHLPLDLRYRVLFITRRMDEILASQRQMLVHRGEDADAIADDVMASSFASHLLETEEYLERSSNFEALYFDHREVLSSPAKVARQIDEFLGGGLDQAAMVAAVDGSLHRNRAPGP